MRIAVATDAWSPQVNGVVRSLSTTIERLRQRNMVVETVTPDLFRSVPCPTYPEIRLALWCKRGVANRLDRFDPQAVHIATEGPIGWAARAWCLKRKIPFTTSFHTRFPDYVSVRTGIPADWVWIVMRCFHGAAAATMAVTPNLSDELISRRIQPVHHWPLGVDLAQFSPDAPAHPDMARLQRPIQLYVGRVAIEKNLEAFLDTQVPGTKVIVGDGPALEQLNRNYPGAVFLGAKHGADLASAYASADVFVFPSLTDTFGLVNIEALASGLPVAAFPGRGPIDIIGLDGKGMHGGRKRIGALNEDLEQAIRLALKADRTACAREGERYEWDICTDRFVAGLAWRDCRSGKPARPGRLVTRAKVAETV